MSDPQELEHFVTLHDMAFFSIALTMYQSLMRQSDRYHLTVVCMDEESHKAYQRLELPNLLSIPPSQWLDSGLIAMKGSRSHREFCWTMASQSYDICWSYFPSAGRVTYLDSDLCFFDSPQPLLDELSEARKTILITEHGFDPKYDQTESSGRFCVQFVTFSQSVDARMILQKWQAECVKSCSEIADGKKFGDQMYLDRWPDDFPNSVYVSRLQSRMLAPWNVDYFAKQGPVDPIFYHFHGLRVISQHSVQAWETYQIGPQGRELYRIYLAELRNSVAQMENSRISQRLMSLSLSWIEKLSGEIRRWFNVRGQRTWMRF